MPHPHVPSQEILRQLYESMTDGVVGYGEDGRIIFCNPGMCVITGRSLEEILGKTSEEAWGVTIQFPDTLRASAISEHAIKRPNGMVRHVSVKTFPLAGTGGLKVAIYRDVSRSRNAMESLRRAEERLHDLLDCLPVILWTADLNLVLTSSLGAGLEGLKYRPNEHQGANLFRFFRTENPDFAPIWATFRAQGGKSQRVSFELGGRRFEAQISPLRRISGEIAGTVGVAQDVTELVRATEDLETTSREYRLLFSESPVGNFLFSPTGRLLNCNRQFLRILGFDSVDAARRAVNLTNWTTPEGENCFRALMENRSFKGESVTARRANGTLIPLEASIQGRFDDDGELIVAQGSVADLTVSHKMERTISRTETQLQGLLSLSSAALIHLSARGRVLDIRADGLPQHARDLQELHGKRLVECLPPESSECLGRSIVALANSGAPSLSFDLEIPLAAGGSLPLQGKLSKAPETGFLLMLTNPPSRPTTGAVQATAGEDPLPGRAGFDGLIGPIAHEFNNHLMGILGHAGLAMLDLPNDSSAMESIRSIEENALAASDFTASLLSRSWPTTDAAPISIASTMEQLPAFVGDDLPAGIILRTNHPPDLPEILGVDGHLLALLSNLVRVGALRLEGEGVLQVEAEAKYCSGSQLLDCLGELSPEEGHYLRLSVSAEARDDEEKLFLHEGAMTCPEETRLLASSLGIVRAQKGYIRAGRTEADDLLYEVFLPLGGQEGAAPPAGKAGSSAPSWKEYDTPPETRLVLLADSEGTTARAAASVLADSGLENLLAHNREDLLDSLRRHGNTLVTVVLDDSLRTMERVDIIAEIERITPGIPILLVAEQENRTDPPTDANVEYLDSPLRPGQLLEKLIHLGKSHISRIDVGLH